MRTIEDYHELFHEIANEAAFAGVVLVCPDNNVPAPTYPAQLSSVISVAVHEGTYEVETALRAVASNAERKDGGCNGG